MLRQKVAVWLPKRQLSETFFNSALLALSGGFQDAYTYFTRDGVFSNAQTGNLVLMSAHLIAGNWRMALRYLLPFLMFATGIFVTDRIMRRYKTARRFHWRQLVLLVEIAILAAVGFMPETLNVAATVLVSFSCAMQVQAFPKINHVPAATTMCIGNLKSGTAALSEYLYNHDPTKKAQAMYYFGIIFFFAVGAGLGGALSVRFGIRAIFVSPVLLFASMMFMSLEKLKAGN